MAAEGSGPERRHGCLPARRTGERREPRGAPAAQAAWAGASPGRCPLHTLAAEAKAEASVTPGGPRDRATGTPASPCRPLSVLRSPFPRSNIAGLSDEKGLVAMA